MKKILTLIFAIAFVFQALAQERINWLSIDKFEQAVKKENKKYFILIDDFSQPNNPNKEALDKRTKRVLSFLEDKDMVDYINEHFVSFRYTPDNQSILFNGQKYDVKEDGKMRSKHDFISFLSSSDNNRLPTIIIKDEKFELFTYKRDKPADIVELEIILEAEKRKSDYILEKVEKDSNLARRAIKTVENFQKQLDKAKAYPDDVSVFGLPQQASRFLSTLKYFISGEYKEIDLRTYVKNKR